MGASHGSMPLHQDTGTDQEGDLWKASKPSWMSCCCIGTRNEQYPDMLSVHEPQYWETTTGTTTPNRTGTTTPADCSQEEWQWCECEGDLRPEEYYMSKELVRTKKDVLPPHSSKKERALAPPAVRWQEKSAKKPRGKGSSANVEPMMQLEPAMVETFSERTSQGHAGSPAGHSAAPMRFDMAKGGPWEKRESQDAKLPGVPEWPASWSKGAAGEAGAGGAACKGAGPGAEAEDAGPSPRRRHSQAEPLPEPEGGWPSPRAEPQGEPLPEITGEETAGWKETSPRKLRSNQPAEPAEDKFAMDEKYPAESSGEWQAGDAAGGKSCDRKCSLSAWYEEGVKATRKESGLSDPGQNETKGPSSQSPTIVRRKTQVFRISTEEQL